MTQMWLRLSMGIGLVFMLAVSGCAHFGQGVPQGEQEAVRWKPRQDVSESLTKLNAEVVELHRGGKYSEALPLAHRALEMSEKALGPELVYPRFCGHI